MTRDEFFDNLDDFDFTLAVESEDGRFDETEVLQFIQFLANKIYDTHEASDKAKDERIAELEAMVEKMKCCRR